MPDVFLSFANFRIDFCFSFNRIGRHKNRDQLCLLSDEKPVHRLFVCLLGSLVEIPTKFSFFRLFFQKKYLENYFDITWWHSDCLVMMIMTLLKIAKKNELFHPITISTQPKHLKERRNDDIDR